jgi:hypothetical protein
MAVFVMSAALALIGIEPAHATTTLAYGTASTTAGRTCTIEFEGDSPYRVAPVSSRINFAVSISCTASGDVALMGSDQTFILPSALDDAVGWTDYTVANVVGGEVEASPGAWYAYCYGSGNNWCSSDQHMYGYPGNSYHLHSHAYIELPATSSSSTAERWTSYPSFCSARGGWINPQRTLWAYILDCTSEDDIRAS